MAAGVTLSFFIHPITLFLAGVFASLASLFILLNSCKVPNQSSNRVAAYRSQMAKTPVSGLVAGSTGEIAALERFKSFLQGIGDAQFIRDNTLQVYAQDAYLDDTLAVHHGAAEIEAYFVNTSDIMTNYQVVIDDVSRSEMDYYVRWTMVFSAPALSGGQPVHSVGISQIRFNQDGKVAFHQDFWDSGKNFYAHLPVVGGAVGFVSRRLQSKRVTGSDGH
jgi:hypothetical protein